MTVIMPPGQDCWGENGQGCCLRMAPFAMRAPPRAIILCPWMLISEESL